MSVIQRAIEEKFEAFMSGTVSEYVFPAGLSVEERKAVKITAEKLGLSSRSYGMGSERQIHIFKPISSMTPSLETIKYSVKNTFVDGPLDVTEPEQASAGPAHQSMPAGSLQEHLAAEESSAGTSPVKENTSSRNSEVDTGSTVDSDSEALVVPIPTKNSFVHFEDDSKENADPRIVQSMPAGTFLQNIQAEKAAFSTGVQKESSPLSLIILFCEDDEMHSEKACAEVFPSTPNAENFPSFDAQHTSATDARHGDTIPVVQWVPPTASQTTALESSIVVLPPAVWAPPAGPAQILLEKENSRAASPAPQAPPPQGLPQGTVPPQPPNGPPPMGLMPGTPVVLQGLASQPDFNGLSGLVSGFDADCGRYNIMIRVGPNALRRVVKVKSQNLLLAQPLMAPQPPSCTCIQPPAVVSRPAKASLVLDQMV
jgi:hypothetical protein